MIESLFPWLILVLVPIFVLVAGAYGAVGLGGATGYLAIMTLFGLSSTVMPSTALTLNLIVTGSALMRYGVAGRMRPSILLPFLLPALPCAFLGGLLEVPKDLFFSLLAIVLAAVGVITYHSSSRPEPKPVRATAWLRLTVGLLAGSGIGLMSGALGIGGGVFLGPLVLLLRWAGPKETAALTAAFVLCISASGLAGHGLRGVVDLRLILPLAVAVLAGGLIGAHLGETRLSARMLRRLLAAILLVAALKAALAALAV